METKIKIDFQGVVAILMVLITATVIVLSFFIPVPEPNKDMVNFLLGVIIGTCLTTVISYYFGSSKGSADKNEMLKSTETK